MAEYSLGLYEKAIPAGLSFDRMLSITKACGFDRLEISIDETDARLSRLDWPASKQRELGQLSRMMDVPIQTMCLSGHRKYPFGAHDPSVRTRSLDIMKKAIEFSYNAGISIIQLAGYDVYYEDHDGDTQKWFEEGLSKAVTYASKRGVVLAFETMETPFMDTVEKSMVYVRKINSPWLGVYPDVGNLNNAAIKYHSDVTDDLNKGKGHIFAAHLKETKPGIYRDMNYGTGGYVEYTRYIKTCLDMGVHIFTGEFWHQDGADYKKVISDSAVFLRSRIEEAL